jgi:homoserine dehydrogenase
LFLAHQLKAHCVLVKDVDGIYTSDPARSAVRTSRFAQVGYETAIRLGGGVVQEKAVRFAAVNKLSFSITSIGAQSATEVGPFADRLDGSDASAEPLRVALLGCGTVGGGVYQRLAASPELFKVIGVGTKTGARARAAGVPNDLITCDLESLVDKPCDVVIELIGGTTRAAFLIERALMLGRKVITANKALLAHTSEAFRILAEGNGTSLHYSAAVGGVLPALETIKRVKANGPLQSFSGVVNGTCNFVLDQLAAGSEFGVAVKLAQEKGYAEEHPEMDLEGTDAAQKLILLARAAFDTNLPMHLIARKGIEGLNPEAMLQARERGRVIRLVAECKKIDGHIAGSVMPVELPLSHPLAQVNGAENRLIVQPELGEALVVSGTGAGRWPTTESIMADLFEIRRCQSVDVWEAVEELEACA